MDASGALRSARLEVLARSAEDRQLLGSVYDRFVDQDDAAWERYRQAMAVVGLEVPFEDYVPWLLETDGAQFAQAQLEGLDAFRRDERLRPDVRRVLESSAMQSLFVDFEAMLMRAALVPDLLGTEGVRQLRAVLLHSLKTAISPEPELWTPPGFCAMRLTYWVGDSIGPLDCWAKDAHLGALLDQLSGQHGAGTIFDEFTLVSELLGEAFASGLDTLVAGTLQRIWRGGSPGESGGSSDGPAAGDQDADTDEPEGDH